MRRETAAPSGFPGPARLRLERWDLPNTGRLLLVAFHFLLRVRGSVCEGRAFIDTRSGPWLKLVYIWSDATHLSCANTHARTAHTLALLDREGE